MKLYTLFSKTIYCSQGADQGGEEGSPGVQDHPPFYDQILNFIDILASQILVSIGSTYTGIMLQLAANVT